jgi:ketosteroid isomerase-like protein
VSEEVAALEEALADSIRRSDADAARPMLTEDFVLASVGGVSPHMPRDEWLDALPGLGTRSIEPKIVDSRDFGDVTVARLLVRWDASAGERDLSGTYAVTDVFRREADGLRLAWRISVRLPDE